jgi:hypothetical protein
MARWGLFLETAHLVACATRERVFEERFSKQCVNYMRGGAFEARERAGARDGRGALLCVQIAARHTRSTAR